MELWNQIVNTAMIGTDKKSIGTQDLPQGLSDISNIILANTTTDKEEKFLQLAALALNYRQAGVLPLQNKQVSLPPAPAEEKAYCPANAMQALKDVLSEESIPLLRYWLTLCAEKNMIAMPELLPALLAAGAQNKNLQTLVTNCCGKRGEWLAGFNQNWNFSANQTIEEQWHTGTTEQRKTALKEQRNMAPAIAREWVQQTWQQEDAATKQNFLELLYEHIGEDDIPFLESLQTEKSKKVKELAVDLLKHIPQSALVKQYQQILQEAVSIKKEKALLGLASKTVMQFQVPVSMDESIFKTGIDKLSSNSKAFTDEEFIIYQLIQSVPPPFWQQQLNSSPEDIIKLWQKDNIGKKMLPGLALAIRKFNDHAWALSMMQHSEVFYVDIIPLLPLQQQDYYSNHFFNQFPDSIIQYAVQAVTEWGLELTKNIFKHTAKNNYQYNKTFYNQHIALFPAKIALELEKCTPAEDYSRNAWSNTSDYILKLLQIKGQIIQSFNA